MLVKSLSWCAAICRSVCAVLALSSVMAVCGPAAANWEPDTTASIDARTVTTRDPRGNSFSLRKDGTGNIVGLLRFNAFLPEPDQISSATPVMFSIDGKAEYSIKEGKWERAGLYWMLVFPVSGPPETGLSEALIDLVEGERIGFRYSSSAVGYDSVSFPLQDPAGVVARAFDVAMPIDRDRQHVLRDTQLRLRAQQRAEVLNPVDSAAEAVRRAVVEHHQALIRERVLDRWMRPARWVGLSCTLKLTLMSTGKVLQVAVVQSSGDAEFDASVAAAVRNASPLPLPADATLFGSFQQLEMVFDPAIEGGASMFSGT